MLSNLKSLESDMKKKSMAICCLKFDYKNRNYLLLVERFIDKVQKKNKEALVKFIFIRAERDLDDELEIEASPYRLFVKIRDLRNFFGIEYNENHGELYSEFKQYLSGFIPKEAPDYRKYSELQRNALKEAVSKVDPDEKDKIYCYGVRINPEGEQRTSINSTKTAILRPELYERLENERRYSFCYTDDSSQEKDDKTILANLAVQEQRLRNLH